MRLPHREGCGRAAATLLVPLLLLGCAAPEVASQAPGQSPPGPSAEAPVPRASEAPQAGRTAPRFVPERIGLPGGVEAPVVPVSTVGAELVVPEDVSQVGWWDGSSWVGDPFGSVVVAGHVDSLDGLGLFHRLWSTEVGDEVVLSAEGGRQAYRVSEVRRVPRTDLVDDGEVFDAGGDPRLVLLTCVGAYDAARGGYPENLVVVAQPVD